MNHLNYENCKIRKPHLKSEKGSRDIVFDFFVNKEGAGIDREKRENASSSGGTGSQTREKGFEIKRCRKSKAQKGDRISVRSDREGVIRILCRESG